MKSSLIIKVILNSLIKSINSCNFEFYSLYYYKMLKSYNDIHNDNLSYKILSLVENNELKKITKFKFSQKDFDNYYFYHINKKNLKKTNCELKNNIHPKYHDEIKRLYFHNISKFRVAVVFSEDYLVLKSLLKNLQILNLNLIDQKKLNLTKIGRENIIRLLYGHETHWDEKYLKGFTKRVGTYVTFVFFKYDKSTNNIRTLKEQIRNNILQSSKINQYEPEHHIHFTDTLTESKWMSNVVYQESSSKFINTFYDRNFKKFKYLIKYVNHELSIRDDKDFLILDSGMAMSLNGLRDTKDIDFLTLPSLIKNITHRLMENHTSYYKKINLDFYEYFFDPIYFCKYKNLKFLSLNGLLDIKKKRYKIANSKKDFLDIIMIKNEINKHKKLNFCKNLSNKQNDPGRLRNFIKGKFQVVHKKFLNFNKYNIKENRFILDK